MTRQAVAPDTDKSPAAMRSPFPNSARVLYAKNPLIEVICQIRFPPVLRIDSEVPAHFQERIRAHFPLLTEEESQLPSELTPELAQLVRTAILQQAPRKSWKFTSEDASWEVTLARDFFALSTKSYTRWEDFRSRFAMVLEALQTEYRPSFLTRIGLRYQNLIVRSNLGLTDISWSELLQPHIAAEYSSLDLSPAIRESGHRVLIELSQNGRVNLRHGTAHKQGEDELLYLIDNDFFTEDKTEVAHVLNRLDLFNGESGRLFRWCITERLHEAMEPSYDAVSGDLAGPDA